MDFASLVLVLLLAQQNAPDNNRKRVDLNLLGQADTAAGESRRNENVQFNLVDNNALKELNLRVGTSATIVETFRPDRSYFGAEYGIAAAGPIHVGAVKAGTAVHGQAHWTHLNSVTTARTFFQVGDVKPARENDYGASVSLPAWRKAFVQGDAGQQKIRGNVNGNVLVPTPEERTALAPDPAVRAIVQRWLDAYPRQLPNRTDVNVRALNTNAPQAIDNGQAGVRLDQAIGEKDRVTAQWNWVTQYVDAFQLVAGQNPDTDTRSHRARLTWSRAVTAGRVFDLSTAFDRVASYLRPEPNAVGPQVSVGGLEPLGPVGEIPIRRAQNLYRQAAQWRERRGKHEVTFGGGFQRRQFNGAEVDAHRGFWSFANDFGRDAITNLRFGDPTQSIVAIGDVHRGFRQNEAQVYVGDDWKAHANVTVNAGLRWSPVARPAEVNGKGEIAYRSDWNNVAPVAGVAWRLPWGVFRAGVGVHFGEIFPVTYGQTRFSPPESVKLVVLRPKLFEPLNDSARGNFYKVDAGLRTPYEYQYNASWQWAATKWARVQLGYVGSRAHKLLLLEYLNRARYIPGGSNITATVNDRRADPRYAETRLAVNGSRGYFDAARVSMVVPRWKGWSGEAGYWFSKSMDLGASYTNTAQGPDSRISRSQTEFDQQRDMKGLSQFDQPHAFLWRGSWEGRGWMVSAVTLVKNGTPFTVQTGADGPGFGNVDGNGGDRPDLLDTSILGRTVGNPDTSRALLPRTAFRFLSEGQMAGSLGRNTFRKGAIRNVNAAVGRSFGLKSGRRLSLRAESVNLLNTPQFADPGVELANGNFGQITNTLNEGRTFRASLAFSF